jgi:hypothetical protein
MFEWKRSLACGLCLTIASELSLPADLPHAPEKAPADAQTQITMTITSSSSASH